MSGPICPRCDRFVFQAEEKHAFGKVWHLFCFSCYNCRKLLDDNEALSSKDEIFCQNCNPNVENSCHSSCLTVCQEPREEISQVHFADDDVTPRSVSSASTSYKTHKHSAHCLRVRPSPTAITAWYNRQHPSRHSDFWDGQLGTCSNKGINTSTSRYSYANVYPYDGATLGENGICPRHTETIVSPNDGNWDRSEGGSIYRQTSTIPCSCNGENSRNESGVTFKDTEQTDPCLHRGERCKKTDVGDQSLQSSTCFHGNCSEGVRNTWFGGGVECRRCGRKVYHAEMMLASGAAFHTVCFSCNVCRKPLDVMNVFESQGEIYCKQCHNKIFGPSGYGYGLGAGALQTM